MTSPLASAFAGFRFPREVISVAVRWYLRYGLSYRDVEELLAERGVDVDHVTVYRWVQRFTPEFVEAARTCRHVPGDRWFVDETYVKVNGRWTYLYRAVDQFGQVIDVWLSTMVGSRPGSDPCGVSRPSDQHGSLPPATPSCRTSDAVTTTSPPTHRSITGFRRRSMSWRSPSDSPAGERSAMPHDRPTQQGRTNPSRAKRR